MRDVRLPTLQEIRNAKKLIADSTLDLPLIPLNLGDQSCSLYLKLENLQVIGSYKIRGAGNVILSSEESDLARGVSTLSAGNLGLGVAWYARKLGFPCTIIVPDHAPVAKTNALIRLGAEVRKVPYERWWEMMQSGECTEAPGVFVHPVFDSRLMAGHGTIGLEIVEEMPDVDSILVPYGGGAMISGIAVAAKEICPSVNIHACEVDTAAPFAAAFRSSRPVEIPYIPSFVDGIGSKAVFPQMWNILKGLVTSSIEVSLAQTTDAIKILIERHHVVAEGAGAVALAAGISLDENCKKIVCVISGGNINLDLLAELIKGR